MKERELILKFRTMKMVMMKMIVMRRMMMMMKILRENNLKLLIIAWF
jgi:hypothetical protein